MVVIIIAILASIALPQYLRVAERSRAAEALTVLSAIRQSEIRFKAGDSGGLYSTDLNSLDIDVPGFGGNPLSQNWTYAAPSGGGIGVDATATRNSSTATILIDLDSGRTCSSDARYGLPPIPTNGNC